MNPILMGIILVTLVGWFATIARTRLLLLGVGGPTPESRVDRIGERLGQVWTFALFQKKMRYYWLAGVAHQLIFVGFAILLLRTVVLVGRGFDPTFNLFILGPEGFLGLPLGEVYGFLKDVFGVLVICGSLVFVYYRTIARQARMSLSTEGLVILGIILVMMIADIVYDGAALALLSSAEGCAAEPEWCDAVREIVAPYPSSVAPGWHPFPDPAGSLAAVVLSGLGVPALVVLAHAGFWTHVTLVLLFLNLLPRSKHFHVITAIPNVFFTDLTHPGRLRPLAKDTESLMGLVEKASEEADPSVAPIGHARIEHFSWKDYLDFYTCTECGRCSDNCPAFTTGKKLSPKQLTLDLRDHLYGRDAEFAVQGHQVPRWNPDAKQAQGVETVTGATANATGDASPDGVGAPGTAPKPVYEPKNLVPDVIDPDVLWACTTCRACEEQCPVMISYVDKIVAMRRNLVVMRGEFPTELNRPFEGMESNGNPWNLARIDRKNWASGLDLVTAAEKPTAPVLFWVGCAASYDDRAKKIARSTAQLLKAAGVDFAILGDEETCTGDPARRAGNEYLFTMLAEGNIATLNGYQEQGGVKRIITTCPHCFNTLLNEYPDFGGKYEVVHHTDYLLGLLAEKKLAATVGTGEPRRVAYHDSCYLGRYNGIYDSPRKLLEAIPGVIVVETEKNRNQGLCCGAGGAQMFMEEQNKDRVNVKRTKELLATGATTVASACPFCMTMLSDGITALERTQEVRQLDVAELLAESCLPEAAAP